MATDLDVALYVVGVGTVFLLSERFGFHLTYHFYVHHNSQETLMLGLIYTSELLFPLVPSVFFLAVPLNIYFYFVVMSLYNRLGPYGDLCVKARDMCEYPIPMSNSLHHPNNSTHLPKGMIYSAYPRY